MKTSTQQGLFISKRIMDLIRDERISPTEGMLLAIIAKKTRKVGPDDGPRGCYTSNTILARMLGIKMRRVQAMLASLVQEKLISTTVLPIPTVPGGRKRIIRLLYKEEL